MVSAACSSAVEALQHPQAQACPQSDVLEVCRLRLPCPYRNQLLANGWQQWPAAVRRVLPAPRAGSPRAVSVSGGYGMTFNPMHGAAQPHAQPGPSPLSSEAPPSTAREALGPPPGQVRTKVASEFVPQVKRVSCRNTRIQAKSDYLGVLGASSCHKVSLNNA